MKFSFDILRFKKLEFKGTDRKSFPSFSHTPFPEAVKNIPYAVTSPTGFQPLQASL